ncbi:MAG: OmpA family protein [Acetobacteraceae bacterium]
MKLRSTLLAATVLALPMAAHAQMMPNLGGFYVGGGIGANYLNQEQFQSAAGNNNSTSFNLKSSTGPVGLGYLGYQLGNGLSIQVEGDVRNNKFNSVRNSNNNFAAAAGGNEKKYGPMVNVIFDLSPYISLPVSPYIGVGAGYQWDHLSNLKVYNAVSGGGPTLTSNSTQGAFAYQAIVGALIPITDTGLGLTVEYRFMGQTARNFGGTVTPVNGPPIHGSFRLGNEFNNALLVGFRYTFGVAPPPPAPAPIAAPAPAPARSYLVFFDWDKATLTDRARQIIREAAQNSTRVQYTQLEVNGYTDTSGTARYNQTLSIRRAENVAAELVRDGVPRNVISIHGFGETHLLVPTGPGVREPQNRRVEIIIR